jgi:Fe-S cluster biosynthesis and repair protein YggX
MLLILSLAACASAGSKIDGRHISNIDYDSIKGLEPGDTIVLHGYADSGNDLEVKIQAHHLLKSNGSESHILECSSDETVYVDLEGNKIFVWVVEKDLDLKTLGVNEKKLDKIDAREKGALYYEDKKFTYHDSDEATWFENGSEDEGVYYWEFFYDNSDTEIFILYFEDTDEYMVELIEELDLNEISINRK